VLALLSIAPGCAETARRRVRLVPLGVLSQPRGGNDGATHIRGVRRVFVHSLSEAQDVPSCNAGCTRRRLYSFCPAARLFLSRTTCRIQSSWNLSRFRASRLAYRGRRHVARVRLWRCLLFRVRFPVRRSAVDGLCAPVLGRPASLS